jgi:hypothetical protein
LGPNVWAQEFASLFIPGPSNRFFQHEQSFYEGAEVRGSDQDLQTRSWRVRGMGPVAEMNKHEITAGIDAGELKLSHPDSRLNDYRTFQGMLGWRYYGKTNKVKSLTVSYGSASDKPFEKNKNNIASGNYLHQFNERWWGAVNWSNNRNFANNVPIPGFFYVAKMSREETLLLGLPFVFWRKSFANGMRYQHTSFIPWNHQMELGYFWGPFSGVSLNFEHRPQQFLRSEREERSQRFFFVEQKLSLVWQGAVIPRILQFRVEAGRAFNRRVFEAENFSQKKVFDIPIEDANFVSAQITSMF